MTDSYLTVTPPIPHPQLPGEEVPIERLPIIGMSANNDTLSKDAGDFFNTDLNPNPNPNSPVSRDSGNSDNGWPLHHHSHYACILYILSSDCLPLHDMQPQPIYCQ